MISILYGFFCEDLREEVGGKTTAVGLWGSGMLMAELPGVLRSLAFHAHITLPPQFTCPFEVVITGPFEPQLGEPAAGVLATDATKTGATVNVIFGPVRFLEEGDVRAVLRLLPEGHPPIEHVHSMSVRLMEASRAR